MYGATVICKKLGITLPTFRDWMNRGHITPCKPHNGQGTRSFWSEAGVMSIVLFIQLVSMGLKRKKATNIISKIDIQKLHTYRFIVVTPNNVYILDRNEQEIEFGMLIKGAKEYILIIDLINIRVKASYVFD